MLSGFVVADVELLKEVFLSRINYYENKLCDFDRAERYRGLMVRLVDLLEERGDVSWKN